MSLGCLIGFSRQEKAKSAPQTWAVGLIEHNTAKNMKAFAFGTHDQGFAFAGCAASQGDYIFQMGN